MQSRTKAEALLKLRSSQEARKIRREVDVEALAKNRTDIEAKYNMQRIQEQST